MSPKQTDCVYETGLLRTLCWQDVVARQYKEDDYMWEFTISSSPLTQGLRPLGLAEYWRENCLEGCKNRCGLLARYLTKHFWRQIQQQILIGVPTVTEKQV